MKIPAISQEYNSYYIYKTREEKSVKSQVLLKNNSGFLSQRALDVYGKAFLLSFGMNNNSDEINEDYFKLPKGAKPDEYQIKAAEHLQNGKSVLVSAPTGTGKTAIAQYVISKNLQEGKKTFYTTPLKALSNQKLLEFRKIYGDENVGILTGDRRENANAPIVVMTTEVYRNMAFDDYFNNKNYLTNEAKTIIFDEFHYLGDFDRGISWEESILFSPADTQILGLSATIGNDEQLAQWLSNMDNKQVELVHVPTENRHVPLKFYDYDMAKDVLFPVDKFYLEKEYDNDKLIKQRNQKKNKGHKVNTREKKFVLSRDYITLINHLDYEDKLPAILFVFNKRFSSGLLEDFVSHGETLTTDYEEKEILDTVAKYEKQHGYLGKGLNIDALRKGYAMHNAGILPIQKELVEELFNKKLLKVVIATETLAAGINMPARTVIISSSEKPTSDPKAENGKRKLTPNEFHQMAGRAGRRGIDDVGHVVTMGINSDAKDAFAQLIMSEPNNIYSRFEPSYSLIANYHKFTKDPEKIKDMFANSFKVYLTGESNNSKKINSLYKTYQAKSLLLADEGYLKIDKHDERTLTSKGELLPNIMGYIQIPLINLITAHALESLSPEELVFLAASIVGADYHTNIKSQDELGRQFRPSSIIKNDFAKFNVPKGTYIKDNWAFLDRAVQKYNSYNVRYNNELNKYYINGESNENLNLYIGSMVYLFAHLNNTGEFSMKNWQKIAQKIDSNNVLKDEGTYYNTVNQTIDLLSQMIDLCNATKNIYELKNDKYYDALADRLKRAIKLLKQPPMENYLYEK